MAGRKPQRRELPWIREAQALGAVVRTSRMNHEWTLEVAAEKMHIDVKHLQKIEAGKANVTLATLLSITAALGEQITVPLTGTDNEPAVPTLLKDNQAPCRPKTARRSGTLLKQIGRKLAELRLDRNLTRTELARAARLSPALVQRIEWGRQKSVSVQQLAQLAECVGTGMDGLLLPPERPIRKGRPPRMPRPTGR